MVNADVVLAGLREALATPRETGPRRALEVSILRRRVWRLADYVEAQAIEVEKGDNRA
ncbi:hypothetical protein [Microbacterium album]|nr:hypothetical protein [Microbacterium album]